MKIPGRTIIVAGLVLIIPDCQAPDAEYIDEGTVLQKIALAEAGDQGVEGMALVMNVIENRVASDRFPNTVLGVVSEPGEFEAYANGSYNECSPCEESEEALAMVQSGWDGSDGATYFHSIYTSAEWMEEYLEFVGQYEDHRFFK